MGKNAAIRREFDDGVVIPSSTNEIRNMNKNGNNNNNCFLDAISITGTIRDRFIDEFKGWILADAAITDKGDSLLPSMQKFIVLLYEHRNDYESNIKESPVYIDFDETRPGFQTRIYWNPNKIGERQLFKIKDILSKMDGASATRLDISFDFYEDLSNIKIFDYSGNHICAHYSRGRKSTGFQLGKRTSPFFVRVYDKKTEIIDKSKNNEINEKIAEQILKGIDNYWRVEFELKDKARALKNIETIRENVEKRINLYLNLDASNANISLEDKALIEYLDKHDAWDKLTTYKNTKLRKLMKDNFVSKRDITSECLKRFDLNSKSIQRQVNGLLKLGINAHLI